MIYHRPSNSVESSDVRGPVAMPPSRSTLLPSRPLHVGSPTHPQMASALGAHHPHPQQPQHNHHHHPYSHVVEHPNAAGGVSSSSARPPLTSAHHPRSYYEHPAEVPYPHDARDMAASGPMYEYGPNGIPYGKPSVDSRYQQRGAMPPSTAPLYRRTSVHAEYDAHPQHLQHPHQQRVVYSHHEGYSRSDPYHAHPHHRGMPINDGPPHHMHPHASAMFNRPRYLDDMPPSMGGHGGNGGGILDAMMQGSPIEQQPTYVGYIKSSHDAILLLSACDLPTGEQQPLPSSSSPHNVGANRASVPPPRRVTRRLLDAERADMVASGCVFAWDEKEAGMKRWTDGRVWSASRVSGCFLTYRELEARKKTNGNAHDGPTSNQYKPEGLIKQSFSVTTTSGRKLHVISYFTKRDVREGRLRRVSEDPRFVGEGGGEWNLKVDEEEYSFPDGHHRSMQLGSGDGQAGENDGEDLDDDEDDEGDQDNGQRFKARPQQSPRDTGNALPGLSVSNAKAAVQRPTPTSNPSPDLQAAHRLSIPENTRKRSIPDDFAPSAAQRPLQRPALYRMRSSSLSGSYASSSLKSKPSSFQSSSASSNDTSITPESASSSEYTSPDSSLKLFAGNGGSGATAYHLPPQPISRSSVAVRALVSPTLPRESAIRGSVNACDMQPSQSQDNASAVGALLSLAAPREKAGPSPLNGATDTSEKDTAVAGLGLSVKPGAPERRDSDQNALDKFSVRL